MPHHKFPADSARQEILNLYSRFYMNRQNARMRGIEFALTFEEWLSIWINSGHYHQRGRKRLQYALARFGDSGAYEVGNVRVLLREDNEKEKWARPEIQEIHAKTHVGSHYLRGIPKSAEHRKKLSQSMVGNTIWLGRKHSPEAKAKISAARKLRAV